MELDIVNGINKMFYNLSRERFYGVVEFQFVDGEIVVVRKQETIKPQALFVVVEN